MKIKNLLKDIEFECDKSLLENDIKGIVCDANKVEKNFIFVCLKSGKVGEELKIQALENGASACLCEEKNNDIDIVTSDIRKAYSIISKNFYHSASDKLKIIAVTGTNGKTTTTHIIANVLSLLGKKVGIVGTLGAGLFGEKKDTGFTTPDPEILHKIFEKLYKQGAEYVVMEASAHAIELKKLYGIKFECVLFLNLTQDHLDFFGDMRNYYSAKKKLFDKFYTKKAVICVDNLYGKMLKNEIEIPYKTFSTGKEQSDFLAKNVNCNQKGISFYLDDKKYFCPLFGKFNVENTLGAICVLKEIGINDLQIISALKNIQEVEGRFNKIDFRGASIIVDFAHAPDGLEKILSAVKNMDYKRILCVFGCGGNRDKQKRPIMGSVVEKYSDIAIVTSDNPRFEEPIKIIQDIEMGMKKKHYAIENRSEAIAFAISILKENDCLIIAGKGGEKEQIIGDKHLPYNDFEEIKKGIEERILIEKNNRKNNNY